MSLQPIAPPADATMVGDWKQTSNGAFSRQFGSRIFPVFDWASVCAGGRQFAAPDGTSAVIRTVTPLVRGGHLLSNQAEEFAQALLAAAHYVAELEAGDK